MNEDFLEQFNDTVVLQDEDGNEQEFEILDAIETDTDRYIALTPVYDSPEDMLDASGELIILRVETDDEGEVLVPIEDDDEYNDILAIFEERLEEDYEIDHADD